MPVSYSDGAWDEFQRARLDVLAQGTGSRVVGIDFPGMGGLKAERGNELSERNIEELKQGRAQEVAEASWDALAQAGVLKDDSGDYLNLVGWFHSQGTFTGAEMIAAAPEGVEFSDVYFSESMALRERLKYRIGSTALALGFMLKGGKHNGEYYKMNEGLDVTLGGLDNFLRRNILQHESHFGMIEALSRGKQPDIMDQVFKDQKGVLVPDKTTVHVVRGAVGLENPEDSQRFAAQMRNNGLEVRVDVLADTGHGWQNSLPALLAQLDSLSITEK